MHFIYKACYFPLSLTHFIGLIGGAAVALYAEIEDVLVIGVCFAQPCNIRVIGIEDDISLEGLQKLLYFQYQRFHLAVTVQLVTEEVKEHQCLQLELGIYNGNMRLVGLQHEIVSLDPALHIAVCQQQRADAGVQVVALGVCYYLALVRGEDVAEIIGDRSLAVCSCHGDDRTLHLESFQAVFIQRPEDESGSVAGAFSKQLHHLDQQLSEPYSKRVFYTHK